MSELGEEKKALEKPLDKLTLESKELHRKLVSYNKDKTTLQVISFDKSLI